MTSIFSFVFLAHKPKRKKIANWFYMFSYCPTVQSSWRELMLARIGSAANVYLRRTFCRPEASTLSLDPLPCALLLAQLWESLNWPFLGFCPSQTIIINYYMFQIARIYLQIHLERFPWRNFWNPSTGSSSHLPLPPLATCPPESLSTSGRRPPWDISWTAVI